MTDVARTRRLARAALANLERHRRRINALNVYPVPDGDTGTNLTLTVRTLVRALDGADVSGDPSQILADATLTMMKGAKGNSGVILSTIARAMAPILAAKASEIDGFVLADALRAGTSSAYQDVSPPVEGTMLTVIREMAEEAARLDVIELPLADALARIVTRGDDAVTRTPQMLDKLREAGVVDAGGVGLVELARGVLHELTGEPLPEVPDVVEELTDESIHQEESLYRYCTSFVVEGEELDLRALRAALEALGDSLLVAGDPSIAKVHLHTDDPERTLGIGRAIGDVDLALIEVSDMHDQAHAREEWLAQLQKASTAPSTPSAVLAVAQGRGNREIFRRFKAALVVEGGPTMNPSVGELLEAIAAVNSEHLIVLPNDSNIRLAAEQARRTTPKDVRVIPTRAVTEGIAAMLPFNPHREIDLNERDMASAAAAVTSAEVTRASRSTTVDGIAVREGEYLGLLGGRAFAAGNDVWTVLDMLLEHFAGDGQSFVQVLRGEGAPRDEEITARYASRTPDLELDVQWGGQPHYPLLLSAE